MVLSPTCQKSLLYYAAPVRRASHSLTGGPLWDFPGGQDFPISQNGNLSRLHYRLGSWQLWIWYPGFHWDHYDGGRDQAWVAKDFKMQSDATNQYKFVKFDEIAPKIKACFLRSINIEKLKI